ncbi:ArsR family transcriptional regulator [Pseudomonas sp.]|uniref:VpaChn25_0724 family phage protein n=1 Tax=Pseudomonas sp. TaxID=306 RepID=UPI003D140BC9
MNHNFADLVASDIRLVILRALAEDPGYSMNDSVLQSVLAVFGHCISRDRVRTELRWLQEQNLVTIQEVTTVLVARLTSRGADVASGAARVDGVKRPSPRG